MQTRRAFILRALAATALTWLAPRADVAAQDRFDQDALLEFETLGNVTLIHLSDIRGQLTPAYMRPAEVSVGVGDARGMVPHLTGEALRIRYGVGGSTPMDYALTHENFSTLAQSYGPMGGLDHVATVVNAIRAERPDALLLVGGDTGAGSSNNQGTPAPNVGTVIAALKADATVADSAPDKPYAMFERSGVKIAVIRQAHAVADISKPATLTADTHHNEMQRMVDEARAAGAGLVVSLSQNGFDIDVNIAANVSGIDVILSSRSYYTLPEPMKVGQTYIIASGSHGRFVSRVDLDVQDGKVNEIRHKLIPIFSDLISPDRVLGSLINAARTRDMASLTHEVGTAGALLYRRGTVQSTWDDLICAALLSQTNAQIALSPGFRWGNSVLLGQKITREDILGVTAVPDADVTTSRMTGAALKSLLETAADGVFNPDPYLRTEDDMLRVGGLAYRLEVGKPRGERISGLILLPDETAIDPTATYAVASWAMNPAGSKGASVRRLLESHIAIHEWLGSSATGRVALVLPA